MELYRTLSEKAGIKNSFISLVGGGGKTTLMIGLASYLKGRGLKVLMTTTTKIMSPSFHDYKADLVFCDDSVLDFFPDAPCSVLYALGDGKTSKWRCPPIENLRLLCGRYDAIINEADGSKRLPLKVHTERDPVVPDFTTYTISVMGLWGIGARACDVAFGDDRPCIVDKAYLQWLVDNPEGLLKRSLLGHRAIVFNGAESFLDTSILRDLSYPEDVFVCTASERNGKLFDIIREG